MAKSTLLLSTLIPFAVLIAAIEFCIGIGILFGSFKRLSTIAGLLFMIFFTPLTLYLALANPVNDCGCFGDALVLTNWETFFKNIFLLGLIIFLYLNQAKITPLFSTSLRWIPVVYAFLFSCTISLIGIKDLPILDFRPYKTGVNIDKAMQAPEGAPQTEYKLVYERNGVKQEFGLDDYPTDSTWTFVETKTIQPSDKWLPAIKDFFLTDQNGDNITSDLLNYDGYTFLLISPDLNTADENYIDRINNIYDYAVNFDYRFYCATVNDESAIAEWIEHTGAEYEYIFSDVTILETIIRSNPGLVLLKDGVILWKKSPRNLPKEE